MSKSDVRVGTLDELIQKSRENRNTYVHLQCVVVLDSGQTFFGLVDNERMGTPREYEMHIKSSNSRDGSSGIEYMERRPVSYNTLGYLRQNVDSVTSKIKKSLKGVKVYTHL